MNAGKKYQNAKRGAKASADAAKAPRWLFNYGGTWWISNTPVDNSFAGVIAEKIEPEKHDKRR